METITDIKVSEMQRKCLKVLAEGYEQFALGESYYLPFKPIAERSGLDIKHIRRTVRALARKGLAEFGKGLINGEGTFAGAGYKITKAGALIIYPCTVCTKEFGATYDAYDNITGAGVCRGCNEKGLLPKEQLGLSK